MLVRMYFLSKTRRPLSVLLQVVTFIELALFSLTVMWIYDSVRLQIPDPYNLWLEDDMKSDENFIVNVLWHIHCSNPTDDKHIEICKNTEYYRFDFLLAALTFF